MRDPSVSAVLADAAWLPLRYDRARDAIRFVHLPRDVRETIPFLTQPDLDRNYPARAIPRGELAGVSFDQAPLHLILHSGLTGSTLLSRALDRPGLASTLSEPPILTDIVSQLISGADRAVASAAFDDVLTLLARPFVPGEAVIVKVGAVANCLGIETLSRRPDSRAVCLHAPLPTYLASVARKGVWGRTWGRRLFSTLSSAGLADLGFTQAELFEQSDLQISAIAWLAIHRLMDATIAHSGGKAQSIGSEAVLNAPETAIPAIAAHFGFSLGPDQLAQDPVFARHSKTGEAFDRTRRASELDAAMTNNREEIDMVCAWAAKVAEAQGIALSLGRPLMDQAPA